ncbi:hypothetical protein [Pseudomonas hunanensis]|uniref:Uncharacterized protein n=1 Tax=Pseudomonas hunanensis TaxID=1247546 RepID=A0ACC9MYP2_9PSED|nr:hypothetical protein [Pseudomonas hunanensis]PKF24039.1 hypothetical protein CW309_24230 [Pseudomonas hunanensis]
MTDETPKKIDYHYSMLANIINRDSRAKIKDIKDYRELIDTTLRPLNEKYTNRYKTEENDDPETIKILNNITRRLHYSRHNEILIKTLVLTIFSTFESIFVSASTFIIAINDKTEEFKKLQTTRYRFKKNITRHKLFLATFGIELNPEHWRAIENLSNLRNIIAHADGEITDEYKNTAKTLANSSIHIHNKKYWLDIDTAYIDEILPIIESTLSLFQKQILKLPPLKARTK